MFRRIPIVAFLVPVLLVVIACGQTRSVTLCTSQGERVVGSSYLDRIELYTNNEDNLVEARNVELGSSLRVYVREFDNSHQDILHVKTRQSTFGGDILIIEHNNPDNPPCS